jgi:hypothetical protein
MRTDQQIAATKTALGKSAGQLLGPTKWLNLGAWLALVWATEDNEDRYPLEARLKNAAGPESKRGA